ncbi:MAG: methylmalonyl Co-A mutase-associated GTPase MeaB [Deltaproteobacteria bacterium]|nr:methylmalonyl Co-A mutase-associated GTPase MeaB [Deltaproteobacteria bacterium]
MKDGVLEGDISARSLDKDQNLLVEQYVEEIRAHKRRGVARAITLIESSRPEQAAVGQSILDQLLPDSGNALRIGITGPPGVGKSTFIEGLGLLLVEKGLRVAVLAVDPSSPVTGGSILGDKTRMETLSQSDSAFVRPSPSGGSLGGVAHRTREVMLLCEAAGYDVILIETVGIGQSEVTVSSMVDFFLVLLLPAGGDQLQGIKRGVMELADLLVVNKADGPTQLLAEKTRQEYDSALSLIRPSSKAWQPRALLSSALEREGLSEIWSAVESHHEALQSTGEFSQRRREQSRNWMWSLLNRGLREALDTDPKVAEALPQLEKDVQEQRRTPASAAQEILNDFLGQSH